MYRILIVDDETIILSGIKFLVDWEKYDCTIADTARNGQDALEKIRLCVPDIVLCDINMPVMGGIELLRTVDAEFPSVVFIMLTNLQEFDLAKDAIRYRAVDYLVKNQLDARMLVESLEKAKKEHDSRSRFVQADRLDLFNVKKRRELMQAACLDLLFSQDSPAFEQARTVLAENRMLDGYGIIYIPFDFASLPDCSRLTYEVQSNLTAWERELTSRLADNLFKTKYLYVQTGQSSSLTLFVWGQGKEWEKHIALLSSKLANASENITQIMSAVCATPCFFGEGQLERCREAYFHCVEDFYLNEGVGITPHSSERPAPGPLGLAGIGSQLEAELNGRNLTGCRILLERASECISDTVHQKSQAIWLCNELYRAAAKTLDLGAFGARGYSEIKTIMTRRQAVGWIDSLKDALTQILWQQCALKSAPVEKARQYVLEHVEERISLQDVADEVNISAGYLSTLFKKQYNQSFIGFINQVKVERACELIAEKKYLISEISYRLAFENAYYFAKVFRRYTGMSPSEWEKANAGADKLEN